jgi:lipopolysaccharide/colanic/teichoic acid biosynthesis glycosyltransferase
MRRAIDIAVSAFGLLVLAPVLLAAAVAVVIDSRGGPFYGGWRVGRKGIHFRMWKFRTMAAGSDRHGSITGRADPRVTRVGAALRRTKLDELPQFWNVLAGDMTLVGPRPEAPAIVELYAPWQRAVLNVKPGVTGRVQLEECRESDSIPAGAGAEDYYMRHLLAGKVQRDLDYLKNQTFRSDLRIVMETVVFVLRSVIPRRHRIAEMPAGGRSWI